MFAIVRRWIMKLPIPNLFTSFWRYYKENYFKSLFGSLLFLLMWFIWVMNFRLSFVQIGTAQFYIYVIAAFVITSMMNYYFSDIVHYKIKFLYTIQKGIYMTIFYIHYTLGAAAATIIALVALYSVHPLLIFLFGGSITAYIYFFAYYQIYLRAKKSDKKKEEQSIE